MLKHAHDQADDGETANAAIHRLVQPAHGQKLFDQSDQDRHGGILFLPLLEGIDGRNARGVFERDVDLETSLGVRVLDDGDFGIGNGLNLVPSGNSVLG